VNGGEGVGVSTSLDSANNFADFNLYSGNPVLSPSSPRSEFRDPQVFCHAPNNSWVMIVATGAQRKIDF
jgi:sucrose-6-phosphate hydrolase SacC (GH32 family)